MGARLEQQWPAECAMRRCLLHSLPGAVMLPHVAARSSSRQLPRPISHPYLLSSSCRQGTFTKASSVQLRNTMRTNESEEVRKAAYEGLRSVGPHVAGAQAVPEWLWGSSWSSAH